MYQNIWHNVYEINDLLKLSVIFQFSQLLMYFLLAAASLTVSIEILYTIFFLNAKKLSFYEVYFFEGLFVEIKPFQDLKRSYTG